MIEAPAIRVAIADTFFESSLDVAPSSKRALRAFVSKFRNNPHSPGINYEKIRNAREPNYRSVRITQDYRGIVLLPEKGNVYIMLWVDKHDDAYAWAQRTRCTIHPATGSLQIYESQIIEEDPADVETTEKAAKSAEDYTYPLPKLIDQPNDVLHQIGVPEEYLETVQELTTMDGLRALKPKLPVEAFEALIFLAEGEPLKDILEIYGAKEETIDTTDFGAAVERPVSQRRIHVYTEDDELLRMLNQPLERWRVYLHPEQRKYARWNVNGPIRILGGAGTGKTVVAMHRAHWLVAEYLKNPADRVLFTTFTANLATDIQENLRAICTPEQLDRIDVLHLDAWVARFVRNAGYDRRIVYEGGKDNTYNSAWDVAQQDAPDRSELDVHPTFYQEEWRRVILPQNIRNLREYLRADRTGRGVALNRKARAEIWPVFDTMRAELARRKASTFEDAVHAAIAFLDESTSAPYRAAIVDEAQDFGPEAMTLLRKLIPENPNDIFIVGDAHQRIYNRRAPLSRAGIHIVGRARRLRLNYRTSEEIRSYATHVLRGIAWDDLDDSTDQTNEYTSLFKSDPPEEKGFDSLQEEADWIVEQIQALNANKDEGVRLFDICVVARTNALADRYEKALEQAGLPTRKLSRTTSDDRQDDAVRIATIHRVKGLGFRVVFVAGTTASAFDQTTTSEDPVERENAEQTERALLHVACTRAMTQLFVTWHGEASQLLNR